MAWDDKELLSKINSLCDYHKWKLRDGTKNPNADDVTKYIFDLKDGPSCYGYLRAVDFFSKKLIVALKRLEQKQRPLIGVVVPSSTKKKVSEGLCAVMSNINQFMVKEKCEFIFHRECLTRAETVSKNAHGGNRSMEKHLDSITVEDSFIDKSKRILLLDDVSTTGNTIKACKELLKQNGAGDIIMLTLAQTALEDE